MNNFPEELLKFLDDSKKHLSKDAISKFVNSHSDLNESEIKFFEEHLNECKICKENLYKIIDEAIDETKTTYEINVNLSTKNHLNFTDSEKNIEGILSKDEDTLYLTFIDLPSYLAYQNIRVSVPDNNLIIRIVSAELNKKYRVNTNEDINFRNNSAVFLDVSSRRSKASRISAKSGYKYLYISAAAILIIITIYLLIINPNNTKQDKLTEIVKSNPIVMADSVPAKTEDTIQNIDTAKPNEQKLQVVDKKSSQVPVKVPAEFKSNSYLERYVNKDKENGIIINPEIGDTMRKQITFKWSPLEAEEYNMSIVNNKNEEIWSKDLFDTRVTLYQKLDPGLYYWKIAVKGKLQTVGKFFVK